MKYSEYRLLQSAHNSMVYYLLWHRILQHTCPGYNYLIYIMKEMFLYLLRCVVAVVRKKSKLFKGWLSFLSTSGKTQNQMCQSIKLGKWSRIRSPACVINKIHFCMLSGSLAEQDSTSDDALAFFQVHIRGTSSTFAIRILVYITPRGISSCGSSH